MIEGLNNISFVGIEDGANKLQVPQLEIYKPVIACERQADV